MYSVYCLSPWLCYVYTVAVVMCLFLSLISEYICFLTMFYCSVFESHVDPFLPQEFTPLSFTINHHLFPHFSCLSLLFTLQELGVGLPGSQSGYSLLTLIFQIWCSVASVTFWSVVSKHCRTYPLLLLHPSPTPTTLTVDPAQLPVNFLQLI